MGGDPAERANALYRNIDAIIKTITPDMSNAALHDFYIEFSKSYAKHPNAATLKALDHVRILLEERNIEPGTINVGETDHQGADIAAALAQDPDAIT